MKLQPLFQQITGDKPIIIAGPCSAETETQTLTTAEQLSAIGIKLFRASLWKPRTKPGCFEGVGEIGLKWLIEVRKKTGMLVSTEVATKEHTKAAIKAGIDFIWIGARTSSNPFAVQDIADALEGHDIPVLIKNPISPDLDLWTGAIERIYNAGIRRIAAIHRGFGAYGQHTFRNSPHWDIPIELHMKYPELPIICDPSHISGKRELIKGLCKQAMELDFDGVIIESHIAPDQAWSDSSQQITPNELKEILKYINKKKIRPADEQINILRTQIDECDETIVELLAKRMKLARQIGKLKQQTGMSILQQNRYNEILDKRMRQAENLSLNTKFIRQIFQDIHTESVNEQIKDNLETN